MNVRMGILQERTLVVLLCWMALVSFGEPVLLAQEADSRATDSKNKDKSAKQRQVEELRKEVATLIEMLPNDFESIAIAHSCGKKDGRHIVSAFIDHLPSSRKTRREYDQASVKFAVIAAKRFSARGLGMGDYKGVHVLKFKNSVLPFVQKSVESFGWKKRKRNGLDTFELPKRGSGINSKGFLVVVDTRTLYFATREHLLPSPTNNSKKLTKKHLAEIVRVFGIPFDLANSLTVFRRYEENKNDRFSPLTPMSRTSRTEEVREFSVESMMFSIENWGRSFQLAVKTTAPKEARAFYHSRLSFSSKDVELRDCFKKATFDKERSILKVEGQFAGSHPRYMFGVVHLFGLNLVL